ncbi:unnamed protein product [Candida verbasci]|uniref:Large ribosomal subunit protein mL67 n=1 Tax=Candida verbasci TaxID=1227364 RepID=A0A9W4TWM0_9ASCO|nr:unnamed protein product [Candida verbasci]
MKSRAEKKMRKFLIEQLRQRKQNGARLAQGKKKTESDLIESNLAPQVFLFKNLFSGQVLYSQVPAFHQDQIESQFQLPNWQNRKPSRRQDLWRIMCIANFKNYEYAIAAFTGLLDLRRTRDIIQKQQAMDMRKKNDDGNIWYSGQYRPTYAQEAIADLSHVIDEFELDETRLYWENEFRKGENKYWNLELVQHETLPIYSPKDQSIMLEIMKDKAMEAFKIQREEFDQTDQTDQTETIPTTV